MLSRHRKILLVLLLASFGCTTSGKFDSPRLACAAVCTLEKTLPCAVLNTTEERGICLIGIIAQCARDCEQTDDFVAAQYMQILYGGVADYEIRHISFEVNRVNIDPATWRTLKTVLDSGQWSVSISGDARDTYFAMTGKRPGK